MKRQARSLILMAAIVPLIAWQSAQSSKETKKTLVAGLKITTTYSGAGAVDNSHGLFVFLFNDPNIGPGATPIAMRAAYKNGEAIVFSNIADAAVYVAVAYDKNGGYDPNFGPPPSGSPVTIFDNQDPNAPTAIQLKDGETAEIKITFDETVLMP